MGARSIFVATLLLPCLALAGCADFSLSRLGYEGLQQRECMQRTGVLCPDEAGGYDTYRRELAAENKPS